MERTLDRGRRAGRRADFSALRPALEAVERRVLLTNYVVTTTSDTPVAGFVTLRQAITAADASPGPNTIGFAFPAVDRPGLVDFDPNFGLWHLHVDSPLPAISNQVTIDGYSQRVLTGQQAANEVQSLVAGGASGGTITVTLHDPATDPVRALPDQTLTIGYTETAAAVLASIPKSSPLYGNVSITGDSVGTTGLLFEYINDLGVRQVFSDPIVQANLTPLPGAMATATGLTLTQGNSGDITSDQNASAVGFTGQVRVVLDGATLGGAPIGGDELDNPAGGVPLGTPATFPGLTIDASGSQVRGLAISGFGRGIVVAPDVVGDLIQGNEIGNYVEYFNPTFLNANPVVEGLGNSGAGVVLSGGSATATGNNTVGGVTPETHNAIAGNGGQGVLILPGRGGNEVAGNLIGVLEQDSTRYFQVGNGAEGVLVESPSNEIGGLAAGSTNVISANRSFGVHVEGPAALENQIQNNYIGTDINGTFVLGQGNPGNGENSAPTTGNSRDGIFLDDAPGNRVGAPNQGQGTSSGRNVISDNFGAGIRISGASATGNLIEGNSIGTDLGGTAAIPNRKEGVIVTSAGNTIGGSASGDGNLISGNLRGVILIGGDATGNQVLGNRIGTDATGAYDLGNALEGVRIDQAPGNTVGGSASGSGNLISGNDLGVEISGASSAGNQVLGNLIGTDATGLLDLGNTEEGVRIDGAPSNAIASGDLISANQVGVVINGATARGNVVQGALIGLGADGSTPLGNESDGVLVENGASNNTIGGLGTGQGDAIAENVRDGVRVQSAASVSDAILSNSIFGNGAHGIDLVAPIGATSGPNLLRNSPVITSVASTSGGIQILGGYRGTPGSTYAIQLFASLAAGPGGFAQGMTFLGTTSVSIGPDGLGTFVGSFPTVVKPGELITGTATDPLGNTSEFSSPAVESIGSLGFSMTSYTASEGDGVATITVDRLGGSGGYATVQYMVSNGTATFGFTPEAGLNYSDPAGVTLGPDGPGGLPTYYVGTLVFDTGVNTASFSIPLLDNAFPGPTTTVNLAILDPSGSATIGTPATATLSILDNDLPGAFRFSAPSYVVDAAQGSVAITVVRDTPGIPVSVSYATAGGSAVPGVAYQPVSGTLSFAEGQTAATFTVPINDIPNPGGDQTVGLLIGNPTGGASLGTPASATLTIQPDLRDRTGPTVRSVTFETNKNRGITGLVVTYSETLSPSTATNLLNYGYSVRTAGRDHVFGTKDDVLIPINSATYDPTNLSVSLALGRVIHPPTPFQLVIDGSTSVPGAGVGVSDLAGNLLDGTDTGGTGSPFVAVLSEKTGAIHPTAVAAKGLLRGRKAGRA